MAVKREIVVSELPDAILSKDHPLLKREDLRIHGFSAPSGFETWDYWEKRLIHPPELPKLTGDEKYDADFGRLILKREPRRSTDTGDYDADQQRFVWRNEDFIRKGGHDLKLEFRPSENGKLALLTLRTGRRVQHFIGLYQGKEGFLITHEKDTKRRTTDLFVRMDRPKFLSSEHVGPDNVRAFLLSVIGARKGSV
jgi:hypothetical protein